MSLKLYYRISDKSYEKSKLPGTDKEICLMNFCKVFAETIFEPIDFMSCEITTPNINIIADNCERKTVKMLMNTGLPVTQTSEGNAGSLLKTIEVALEECEDDDIIYFCEDDYLHLPQAPKLIQEVAFMTDYFTLYDHPDKYTAIYEGGEDCKVFRTRSSHWRTTVSTCMTFGTTGEQLKKDKDIWLSHLEGEKHPHDHLIFLALDAKLSVCIPGVACHTDLTFSGMVDRMMMDDWAIELATQEIQSKLNFPENSPLLKDREGWNRLVMLDALWKRSLDEKVSV